MTNPLVGPCESEAAVQDERKSEFSGVKRGGSAFQSGPPLARRMNKRRWLTRLARLPN